MKDKRMMGSILCKYIIILRFSVKLSYATLVNSNLFEEKKVSDNLCEER